MIRGVVREKARGVVSYHFVPLVKSLLKVFASWWPGSLGLPMAHPLVDAPHQWGFVAWSKYVPRRDGGSGLSREHGQCAVETNETGERAPAVRGPCIGTTSMDTGADTARGVRFDQTVIEAGKRGWRRDAHVAFQHPPTTMECVFPQEIIDDIIDHFQDDYPPRDLQTCSLVAKSWVPRSRRSLFRDVSFPGKNKFGRWCKAIPPGPDRIASYTRVLRLSDPWGKLMDPTLLRDHLDHFTSFRSLQSLVFFLVDLSAFDRDSITTCFRHFETVKSLILYKVLSPITNILLLTYLFPNLQRLDIDDLKPPKDIIVMDVPLEAEPFMLRTLETAPTLQGSFRMANIPVGASQLLSWFLKFPLDFEEIRITECDWTSTDPLSRLIEACGPKLRLLEIYVPLGLSHPPGMPLYLTCLTYFPVVGGRINWSTPLVLNSCTSLHQITLTLTSLWRPTSTNDELLSTLASPNVSHVTFNVIPDTTQAATDALSVDVPGWSTIDTTLYRLAQRYADSGFEGKVHVTFKIDKDFHAEAKEIADKLEPDGFLASFRQRGVVTIEKAETVITLSGL